MPTSDVGMAPVFETKLLFNKTEMVDLCHTIHILSNSINPTMYSYIIAKSNFSSGTTYMHDDDDENAEIAAAAEQPLLSSPCCGGSKWARPTTAAAFTTSSTRAPYAQHTG